MSLGWSDLMAALCLVAVIEGLFLFAAPRGWKQAVEQLAQLPETQLRRVGAVIVVLGVVSLYFVRG